MSSKLPIVRPFSWIMAFPLIFVSLLLFFLIDTSFPQLGIGSYFAAIILVRVLRQALRFFPLRYFYQAFTYVKQERFSEAIAAFEQSYTFLSKYSWIDRFRAFTMLTSAAISFREMALVDIAFCYEQLGAPEKMLAYYEQTLREFPQSTIAKDALRMLGTAEK